MDRIEAEVPDDARLRVALSFVPDDVLRRYVGRSDPPDADVGEEREASGCLLFADAVGFTKLSEELGPEELAAIVNGFFGQIIELRRGRAEVPRDALACSFEGPLPDAAARAMACAAAVQASLGASGPGPGPASESLRASRAAHAPPSPSLAARSGGASPQPRPLPLPGTPTPAGERAAPRSFGSAGPGGLSGLDAFLLPEAVAPGASGAASAANSSPRSFGSALGAPPASALRVKIGIGAGRFFCMHVGGVGGRWEFLVTGPALEESLRAEGAAQPGQTVATRQAPPPPPPPRPARRLESPAKAEAEAGPRRCRSSRRRWRPGRGGAYRTAPVPGEAGLVRLLACEGAAPPRAGAGRDRGAALLALEPARRERVRRSLEGYVATAAALKRLYAGQPALLLAEIRTASVLFVGAPPSAVRPGAGGGGGDERRGGGGAGGRPALRALHGAVRAVQATLAERGGSLRQVASDDKGSVLLGAFGLPGTAHGYADDAARAVDAALEAKRRLEDELLECSIGICTGRVFCGLVGGVEGTLRCEYAMVGSVVNKAARLMSRAGRDVLVDETTHGATAKLFRYLEAPPVELKGFHGPVKAFRPLAPVRGAAASVEAGSAGRSLRGGGVASTRGGASLRLLALAREREGASASGTPKGSGPGRAESSGALSEGPARAWAGAEGAEPAAGAGGLDAGPVRGRQREVRGSGREREEGAAPDAPLLQLEALRGALAEVEGGPAAAPSALFAFVEAEAGMGKSSLVRALCVAAAADGFRVFDGAASEVDRATPYLQARPGPAPPPRPPARAAAPPPAEARGRQEARGRSRGELDGGTPRTVSSDANGSFRARRDREGRKASGGPGGLRSANPSFRLRHGSAASAAAAAAAVFRLPPLEGGAAHSGASVPASPSAGLSRAALSIAEARILSLLPPELAARAPLLNDLLDLGFPESHFTSQLSADVRAEGACELVCALLRAHVRSPTLFVLEDCHWADSLSLALAAAVAKEGVPLVAIVATTRPVVDGPAAAVLARLTTEASGARRLRMPLGPLSRSDTVLLVVDRLMALGLPPYPPDTLINVLYDRTQGRPLFTEEMVRMMAEKGLVRQEGGTCGFDAAIAGPVALDLPDSVLGVIAARVDRLESSQQLTLKVASVLGRSFDADFLVKCYPMAARREAVLADLAALVEGEFIMRDAAGAGEGPLAGKGEGTAFTFKHQLVVDGAYRLLLRSQAQAVHARVAALLEEQYGTEESGLFALLAHHHDLAEDAARAVAYFGRAAEEAARAHASGEVVALASRALARAPRGHPAEEKARLEMLLGQAHCAPRWAASVLGQLLRQLAHRAAPRAFAGRRAGDRGASTAVACYDVIGQLATLQCDQEGQIAAFLTGLNLAEAVGSPVDLARSFGNAAMVLSAVGMRGVAAKYVARARGALAECEGEPSAASYLGLTTAIVHFNQGEWEGVVRCAEAGLEIAHRYSLFRRVGELCSIAGAAEILSGEGLPAARGRYTAALETAVRRTDAVVEGYSLGSLMDLAALCGDPGAFAAHFRSYETLLASGRLAGYPALAADAAATIGAGRIAYGDAAGARARLERAVALLRPLRWPESFALFSYLNVCNLALRVWQAARAGAPGAGDERAARALMLAAEAELAKHAASYPFSRAPLALMRAVRRYYEGAPAPPAPPTGTPPALVLGGREGGREALPRGGAACGMRIVRGLALSALGVLGGARGEAARREGAAVLAAAGVVPGWCPFWPPAAHPLAPLRARKLPSGLEPALGGSPAALRPSPRLHIPN
eukprot:tig00000391_g24855.t1